MPPPLAQPRTFGARADRARRRFEIPVFASAILVVPVIAIEERAVSRVWLDVAAGANWVIWLVFVVEFLVVLALADSPRRYARFAWLDLTVILISFPLLGTVLAGVRLLRLARVARVLRAVRLLRLAALVSRGGAAARTLFRKRGLGYIVALIFLIGFGVGGIFAVVEGSSVADGLWWAIVTVTTVGYGDFFPVTAGGRIAAAILMVLGIGLIAVLTASVAAHFVEHDEKINLEAEVGHLHKRLDDLERLLRDLGDKHAGT